MTSFLLCCFLLFRLSMFRLVVISWVSPATVSLKHLFFFFLPQNTLYWFQYSLLLSTFLPQWEWHKWYISWHMYRQQNTTVEKRHVENILHDLITLTCFLSMCYIFKIYFTSFFALLCSLYFTTKSKIIDQRIQASFYFWVGSTSIITINNFVNTWNKH